ncbi:MAG: citrate synthase [Dehalococcoidia bacterium]|nr:citrate synthase [Dehalococcoidia bacterium]
MPSNDLTITDNRTGKQYTVPIENGTVRSLDLRQIKTSADDFGLLGYDPSFDNTASCKSAITFIDGDKGILRHRGYPIDELAAKSTFLEVAYLVLYGELPTKAELAQWEANIKDHTFVHENIRKLIDAFQYDAHPMGILVSAAGALSTFYPDAKNVGNAESRELQIARAIAKMPTLAAYAYRHRQGQPYVYPDNDLSYAGNLLNMLWKKGELKYKPNPVLERALDLLFILHADHEQNCSTNAMRSIGSSQADPYVSLAGAIGALYGPLHGGANEAAINMLRRIGSKDKVNDFIKGVKVGNERLMGFGHRVYKNYDPRAKIIRATAEQVFETTGRNPLIDIATELERIALQDEYFISRRLYPNVDFYSGIIYQAMGFSMEMYPVLFAIARTSGWLAQWREMQMDPQTRIARPRQVYTGPPVRAYVPLEHRNSAKPAQPASKK